MKGARSCKVLGHQGPLVPKSHRIRSAGFVDSRIEGFEGIAGELRV